MPARVVQVHLVERRHPQILLEPVRLALGDDAASVDDGQAAGQPIGLVQVMRSEQHGHLVEFGQPGDFVPHRRPRLRVESGCRLVEEQHLRPVHEAERDVEAALHAAGVGADEPARRLGQREALQELVRPAPGGLGGLAVEVTLEDEVLAAGGGRVGPGALADDADDTTRLGRVSPDVDALDGRAALVGDRQRGQDLDGGSLAGAVRADQGVDRAGGDGEVKAVERKL